MKKKYNCRFCRCLKMIWWSCKKCGETFDLFDYETGTELSDAMK